MYNGIWKSLKSFLESFVKDRSVLHFTFQTLCLQSIKELNFLLQLNSVPNIEDAATDTEQPTQFSNPILYSYRDSGVADTPTISEESITDVEPHLVHVASKDSGIEANKVVEEIRIPPRALDPTDYETDADTAGLVKQGKLWDCRNYWDWDLWHPKNPLKWRNKMFLFFLRFSLIRN